MGKAETKKPNYPMLDLVLGAFVFGRELDTEVAVFPIQSVYDGFMKLSIEFPDLYGDLYFSTYGGPSYSKRLEHIFFSLGTVKILEVANPGYQSFQFEKSVQKRLSCDLEKRLSGDIATIQKAGKIFYDTVFTG